VEDHLGHRHLAYDFCPRILSHLDVGDTKSRFPDGPLHIAVDYDLCHSVGGVLCVAVVVGAFCWFSVPQRCLEAANHSHVSDYLCVDHWTDFEWRDERSLEQRRRRLDDQRRQFVVFIVGGAYAYLFRNDAIDLYE